jgi:glycosyltransferase 2 family protein
MKRIAGQLLKWGVSIALVGWLLHRIGLGMIFGLLKQADPIWITAGLVLFFLSHLLGSVQWRMLLSSDDIHLTLKKVQSCYFVGLFFNNFLIGGAGGDVFRMLDVSKSSKKGTGAVSSVLLDRMMGFLVMSGMTVLAIPFALRLKHFGGTFWTSFFVMVAGWVFLLSFFFSKRFAKLFTWVLHPFIPAKMQVKMREVYRKIHAFGRQQALLLRTVLISLTVQSARILTHYLVARSFGVTVPPVYYFLFIPIIAIMATLPVSIGGIGLREQTGVVLFTLVGMTAVQAVAVEFTSYLVAIATSIPGGVIFAARGGFHHSTEHKESQR